MGMIVQHNMNALNAYNRLNANVAGMKKASEKLSSGYRINRAGDDAAGLAISEKMRSQIKGLNQAIRNSQDGINMIQTFEGAAQETHSILQRMKELATESANGTYDNATDRAAIQLEFDQLNDELNQIADTDFNGTIVLNGGEMADGLKQVDGEFNYANKADQAAAAKAAIEAQIAELEASKPEDIGANAGKWDSVDDNGFNAANATQLWKDLGLGEDVKDVDVTFTWDGTAWKATSAKAYDGDGLNLSDKDVAMDDDKKGNLIDGVEIDLSKITVAEANKGTGTGKGGFTVSTSAGNEIANAIFDASDLKVGDTVTLNFANPAGKTYAPKNAGLTDDSMKELAGKFKMPTASVDKTGFAAVSDADMNNDWKTIMDDLKDMTIDMSVTAAATPTATPVAPTVKNATVAGASGANYSVTYAAGKITIKNAAAQGGIAANTTVAEISIGNLIQEGAYTTAGAVDFTLGITMDAYAAADPADVPDVTMTAGEPDLSAINAKIEELKKQLTDTGVTKADAFDNSTARMTYTSNITLQTGSRTKDAVNFSFKYNTDGTADMGNLEANLNLSARAEGLNTANLSLATADEANYAIDQIDKAINKTSMVRATFGSIQNRLEHKITNLTTTSENLQEAESSIRDTDMASEMMNYTKYNILQQAAQSMLAQANQQPQSILQLLG